jgi:hypothetical protein
MSAGVAAMLLGIFGVPATLLWAGHKMRRRSRAWHGAFWGAIIGHLLALVIGLIAAMIPPEQWSAGDRMRGLLGLWSFLLFPALGGAAGWLRARTRAR